MKCWAGCPNCWGDVQRAKSQWPSFADEAGLDPEEVAMIGAQMADRRELSRLKSSPCEHTPPGRRKSVETTWTCPAAVVRTA